MKKILLSAAILFIAIIFTYAQCPVAPPPAFTITDITTDMDDYCDGSTITATATVSGGVGGTDWFLDWEVSYDGGAFAPIGAPGACPYNANDVVTFTPPPNTSCNPKDVQFRAYLYYKLETNDQVANLEYDASNDTAINSQGICAQNAANVCVLLTLAPVNPTGLSTICDVIYDADGTTVGYSPSFASEVHFGYIAPDGTCSNQDGGTLGFGTGNSPWNFSGTDNSLACASASGNFQACFVDDFNDAGPDGIANNLCIQVTYWDAPDAAILSDIVAQYPAPPTVEIMAPAPTEGCSGDIVNVTLRVLAADGTECSTKPAMSTIANTGCTSIAESFTFTCTKAEIEAALTAPPMPDCYVDTDVILNVTTYPNANNFIVAETQGDCGIAAMVSITAENGDECFAMLGTAPMDPGCDNPDDVQDMMYMFDPGFIAACNATFSNTIPASCATTAASSDPAFTCPPNLNFCQDNLVIDLDNIDNNAIAGATGVFSGSGTQYVVGNQDPGMGTQIDLSNAPVGVTLTLEYTVTAPGCPPVTTVTGCTFNTFIDCDADGGSFPSGN